MFSPLSTKRPNQSISFAFIFLWGNFNAEHLCVFTTTFCWLYRLFVCVRVCLLSMFHIENRATKCRAIDRKKTDTKNSNGIKKNNTNQPTPHWFKRIELCDWKSTWKWNNRLQTSINKHICRHIAAHSVTMRTQQMDLECHTFSMASHWDRSVGHWEKRQTKMDNKIERDKSQFQISGALSPYLRDADWWKSVR